jgi:hypothetical protein
LLLQDGPELLQAEEARNGTAAREIARETSSFRIGSP